MIVAYIEAKIWAYYNYFCVLLNTIEPTIRPKYWTYIPHILTLFASYKMQREPKPHIMESVEEYHKAMKRQSAANEALSKLTNNLSSIEKVR